MKKSPLILLLFVFTTVGAQVSNSPFNNFQRFVFQQPNADSAAYYLHVLGNERSYKNVLGMYVHDIFAQNFIPQPPGNHDAKYLEDRRKERMLSLRILGLAAKDTSQQLAKTLKPLLLWVHAQEEGMDDNVLTEIGNAFLADLDTANDFYSNRKARYGLLLYAYLKDKPTLVSLAQRLMVAIENALQKGQVIANENSTRADLDRRAWYRYMWAALNYTRATETSDATKKLALLKEAFAFSPDVLDLNHQSAFFYDEGFLFPEDRPSFKEAYIAVLERSSDKVTIQTSLLQAALAQPVFKEKLERFYALNNPGQDFKRYWQDAIQASGTEAPAFALSKTDNSVYNTHAQSGKWMLIDFWGTWCGPCRQEHPQLQRFYDSVISPNADKISLLTIACRDTLPDVLSYMSSKHFSFPVAMSDNRIEQTYRVQGYPTKILVTSRNRYIVIPYGEDWVGFTKAYTGL